MDYVALLHAEAGSAPKGTGSYYFFSNFSAAVANLAFVKTVGIWGHVQGSASWSFFTCSFSRSAAGNEIWQAHLYETRVDEFGREIRRPRNDVLGQ